MLYRLPSDWADSTLTKFAILDVRTRITRGRWNPTVPIILPLWMIGLAAVGLLCLKDDSFSNIEEVWIIVFLIIVTYSIGLAQIIPRSDVISVADKLFFGTFLTVFLVFLKVVLGNSGILSVPVRNWMNHRSRWIGFGALTLYCGMMILALTGMDVFTKEWFDSIVHRGLM